MNRLLTILLALSYSFNLSAQKQEYFDIVNDKNIKSVLLYPYENTSYPEFLASSISLDQSVPLLLEFDELYYDFTNYTLKLIHCNADWRKSMLSDIEILNLYNDFPITDFEYSQNTLVPYTHYKIIIPNVRVSGNYVAAVYRKGENTDPILAKRFVVFENQVSIALASGVQNAINNKFSSQQIGFTVQYGQLESFNPMEDFKIVIKQNQRWDNAIYTLKPSMLREFQKSLEFQHFNNENAFLAGNEFRLFDLRFQTNTGQNIAQITRTADIIKAQLLTDKSRNGQAYSIYNDQNGLYFIGNLEAGNSSNLGADYMDVTFTLNVPAQKEKIFVIGSFNNWQQNKENELVFDKKTGLYTTSMKLKQGFYNYLYWTQGEDPYQFEGSHFQTRNQYEIFVYYRKPGTLFDKVVGYYSFFTGIY
jgi:hypothetical protein